MFQRNLLPLLQQRAGEPRRFIQVLQGPRQVGKTTLVHQCMAHLGLPFHYATADEASPHDKTWLIQQWDLARIKAHANKEGAVLIIDEVQKIKDWSTVVKWLWDEDTKNKLALKVFLLGSSPWLVEKGIGESLAGRFELIPVPHWSLTEMKTAFGWDLDHFLYFGAYPGSAELIGDEPRWKRYILDSLVETTLSRDILLMNRIDKPILLRRLFQLGCEYSGQIVSYQKMVGQLQDVGNTTTLAYYLTLLSGAGLVSGIQKFSGQKIRQRGSSPKLQILNTALMSCHSGLTFEEAQRDRDYWGRLVESAVGAYLLNGIQGTSWEVFYWREGSLEVDFVIRNGKKVIALEVKSGRKKESLPGMGAFTQNFKTHRQLVVGNQGVSLEEFLTAPLGQWVQ